MCQPPNANSPAATASEKFVSVTGGNAVDGADGGASPLSAQPRTMIAIDGEHLHHGKRRLHAAAELDADVIDGRQHQDGADGHQRAARCRSSGTKKPA